IADRIKPTTADIPALQGVDVYGETLPLRGAGGGDHIIYVDFQKRYDLQERIERAETQGRADIVENLKACRKMAGIVHLDVSVSQELCTSFPPIGTHPSNNIIDRRKKQSTLGFKDQYQLNEWKLMGTGDILLLYTDGLSEHMKDNERYFPEQLERKVRKLKHKR